MILIEYNQQHAVYLRDLSEYVVHHPNGDFHG